MTGADNRRRTRRRKVTVEGENARVTVGVGYRDREQAWSNLVWPSTVFVKNEGGRGVY